MVLIYSLGGTSGAHFNPAVTFALWALKKISTPNAVVYVICQCIGGILGALVVLLLFKDVGDARQLRRDRDQRRDPAERLGVARRCSPRRSGRSC